jgi:hypothetical protein
MRSFVQTERSYESNFLTIFFSYTDVPESVLKVDKAVEIMAGRSLDLIHGVRQKIAIFFGSFVDFSIVRTHSPDGGFIYHGLNVCSRWFFRDEK